MLVISHMILLLMSKSTMTIASFGVNTVHDNVDNNDEDRLIINQSINQSINQ